MGGACGTYKREDAFRNLKGRDRYEDRRKWEVNLEGIKWEVVDWMRLTQNRDTWLTLVGR